MMAVVNLTLIDLPGLTKVAVGKYGHLLDLNLTAVASHAHYVYFFTSILFGTMLLVYIVM